MPMPVMTPANATATGDMIVGPGALTTMVKGLPVATVCAVTPNMNDIF